MLMLAGILYILVQPAPFINFPIGPHLPVLHSGISASVTYQAVGALQMSEDSSTPVST